MAIEGKLKTRDGKLYVVYATTLSTEPVRRTLWWKVIESYSPRYYNGHRPSEGDTATARTGEPGWTTSAGNVHTGRVTNENDATFVEESPVLPPKVAGTRKLRWNSDRGEGRWEKLMATGWQPAGEGVAETPKVPRARVAKPKTPKQLDAEIAAELAGAGSE